MFLNKDVYCSETDGRMYRLCHEVRDSNFVTFDERELIELVEVIYLRRKKLALKIIAVIEDVERDFSQKNLFLEEVKQKCLGHK